MKQFMWWLLGYALGFAGAMAFILPGMIDRAVDSRDAQWQTVTREDAALQEDAHLQEVVKQAGDSYRMGETMGMRIEQARVSVCVHPDGDMSGGRHPWCRQPFYRGLNK